jgi:hypothetical protein
VGNHDAVDFDRFPDQARDAGARVRVTFHYQPHSIGGKIVRFDAVDPFEIIIALDDGRFVRSAECQFTFEADGAEPLAGDAEIP